MDEPPPKRRGPLLWLASRSRRFWLAAIGATPVAYVASLPVVFYLRHHLNFSFGSLGVVLFDLYIWPLFFFSRCLPRSAREQLWDFLMTFTH